jgi:hypothetical protein
MCDQWISGSWLLLCYRTSVPRSTSPTIAVYYKCSRTAFCCRWFCSWVIPVLFVRSNSDIHCWRGLFSHIYSVNCIVLGPAEFTAHTEDAFDVYNWPQAAHHNMFADDQQLYLHTTILAGLHATAKGRLLASSTMHTHVCGAQHDGWSRTLIKQNWSGSALAQNSKKLSTVERKLIVDGTTLQSSEVVRERGLGILSGSEMKCNEATHQ